MSKETVSIEQLFQEELDAVIDMMNALEAILEHADPLDSEYYELKHEILKLEFTGQYLADRLNDDVPCRFLK